jgi:hypothetical protein
LPIPGLDVVNATIALPLWAAGALAALFVVLGVIAIVRFGANAAAGFMRLSIVLIVAGLAWVYLDRLGTQDRLTERTTLEARLAALDAQANAPGSALGCLNGLVGETVEMGCEKAVFATPETVAAAVTYTSARLSLLAEGAEFLRSGASRTSGFPALKRSLEADPFGLVAHVLATRDNCTGQQCDAFLLLSDASKVQANIRDQAYLSLIGRYAATWPARAGRSAADPTPVASVSPQAPGATMAPVSSKYNFPSAASIPPVSIMNAEPGTPTASASPPPAQAAAPPPAPAAAAAPPTPQRRPQAAPTNRPPRTANQQAAPARNAPLPLQAQPAAPPPQAAAPAAESDGALPPPPPHPGLQ